MCKILFSLLWYTELSLQNYSVSQQILTNKSWERKMRVSEDSFKMFYCS